MPSSGYGCIFLAYKDVVQLLFCQDKQLYVSDPKAIQHIILKVGVTGDDIYF
jgi:hypothetical protein